MEKPKPKPKPKRRITPTPTAQAPLTLTNKAFHFEFTSELARFWVEGAFCDLIVVAGEQSFKVHSLVLAACSAWFRKRLQDSTPPHNITLPNTSPEHFEKLLWFAYTGTVEAQERELAGLLALAEWLEFRGIRDATIDAARKRPRLIATLESQLRAVDLEESPEGGGATSAEIVAQIEQLKEVLKPVDPDSSSTSTEPHHTKTTKGLQHTAQIISSQKTGIGRVLRVLEVYGHKDPHDPRRQKPKQVHNLTVAKRIRRRSLQYCARMRKKQSTLTNSTEPKQ